MKTVTEEQIAALADELVDYIVGEPERTDAALASAGSGFDKASRKRALQDEVALKIKALTGAAPAPAPVPASGSAPPPPKK